MRALINYTFPARVFSFDIAGPLRLEIAGGRYDVTPRGIEGKSIFREDTDRERSVELLCEMGGTGR